MADDYRDMARAALNWAQYAKEQGIAGLGDTRPAKASVRAPTSVQAAAPVVTHVAAPAVQKAPALVRPISGAGAEEKRRRMEELAKKVDGCRKCALANGRTNIVFGTGDPASPLVFVGEGPGADEDAQGLPFVGRAGQLLNKMIESIGLRREQVYICNVVKCRPPNNRDPEPEEAEACWPYLEGQLTIIQPRLVVGLGATAVKRLMRKNIPIGKIRGQIQPLELGEWSGDFLPTFHPAYLLRSPGQKAEAMRDFFKIKSLAGMG